jgi:Fe-S-cluster-containing dehydrogenase component
VKTCPTGAIQFGTKQEMLNVAENRVEQLKSADMTTRASITRKAWAART